MSMSNKLLSLACAIIAFCLIALPAHAQAPRTWVSGVGDDANPCSRTAPCKTFPGAISKTAVNGEINCLDSAGFGAVTITKSISIICEGVIGGIVASGTNGIVVNVASTDVVYLRGLDIQGLGTGLSGIRFTGAGVLHVEKCLIRGFNGVSGDTGINFVPTGTSELCVSDTFIADNGTGTTGGGIIIKPTGAAATNIVLSRVHVENNISGIGLDLSATTGGTNLAIVDSVASGNSFPAITDVTTAGHGPGLVMLNNVTATSNNVGVRADGPGSFVVIGSSTIFRNVTGVISANGGILQSYKNNQITANLTDGTPIPQTPLN